jgi:DNA-binding beta-propeller fold protein YncE
MRHSIAFVIVLLLIPSGVPSIADDTTVETVLTGLSNPSGVAIRPGGTPERYEVFVADAGARRIVKISSNEPNRSADVITGFPAAASTAGGRDRTGNPFCLLFLDEKHLIAGLAGTPPDVRLYKLSEAAATITADAAKQLLTPQPTDGDSEPPHGSCAGLARTRANEFVADMLLLALRDGDGLNGVWKVPVRAGMLDTMTPLETKPAASVSVPTALAVSEQGYLLIAADDSSSPKTRLVFINPTNGQSVLQLQTELREIAGLAYSPKSGNLYALAKAIGNESEQGLFRIDDASMLGQPGVKELKLADIPRPTSLAFAPDGALYITSLGEDGNEGQGALLKITAEL